MGLYCTRCQGDGFINLHQIPDSEMPSQYDNEFHNKVLEWIASHNEHDVSVCDCCGDGENWYGTPGEHNDYGKNGSEPFPECF